jgi:hypothetical protein
MSIHLIAKDLYRLEREVSGLEKELESAPLTKREAIQEKLRKVRAERNRMRGILEGAKEEPSYRKPM